MKKYFVLFTFLLSSNYFTQAASINYNLSLTDPLFQHWILDAVIVDGAQVEPGAIMVGDILYINDDNTIQTILSGITLNGTWMIDQTNTLLTITSTDLTSYLRLRILEMTDTALKIQQVNEEGVITILLFEPE